MTPDTNSSIISYQFQKSTQVSELLNRRLFAHLNMQLAEWVLICVRA
jgi:hypothetical protein